jgi:hypothetical protein
VQELSSVFKKRLPLFILLLCLYGCTDIPRDNPLDPKNKHSIRPQVVALDVFVNTDNDFEYNQFMLSALNQLQQKYAGQITIAEYHRNTISNSDSFYVQENEFLYNTYINAYAPNSKGVPDVFLNGITSRVQGASTVSAALTRLELALQPLLLQNSFFTLEPQVEHSADQLNITVKLARLGSESVDDILLKAILTEKIDDQYLQRVVRHILISDIIPQLSAGEIKTIKFPSMTIKNNATYDLIFNLTSKNELTIYQSLEMSLP